MDDTGPLPLRTLAVRGAVAMVATATANYLLLLVVLQSGVVDPFGALRPPPVVALSVLGALAATTVYGAITRAVTDPDWLFARVAAVALLLSFLPDLAVLRWDPTATLGAVFVLMGMHVVAAVICVVFLTDWWSPINRPDATTVT